MIKIDNTPKFKIGDMVWSNIQDRVATIKGYSEKYDMYELDGGFMADEDNLEPLDMEKVKHQFLNELQLLLTKYKARIYDEEQYQVWMDVGEDYIYWSTTKLGYITPENIFNYEKNIKWGADG